MDEKELKAAVDAIEGKIKEAVSRYETEVKECGKATSAAREELKALAKDHADLMKEDLSPRLKAVEHLIASGGGSMKTESPRSWGDTFVGSELYPDLKSGKIKNASIEVKNTIIGEGGSPQDPVDTIVPAQRLAGIVPGAFRALNILDFVPTGTTGSNQIEYTRELAWTNAAAETAESSAKPESTLTFELVTDPVRTVPHFIKASKQILDDAPMLASYIDRRMEHGVRNRLQLQILRGNGTSPNISGLSASGRHTAFTPTSGENQFDSINRAKYAVIGADYSPNFVLLNPADWGAMERLKRGASDDAYVAGDGAALSYVNNGLTPVIWGLPVVASNDVEEGKFYVGDSNAFQLFMRQGIQIEMGFVNDDFTKNLITIRAELRAALAVYTPLAIRYGDLTL